MNVYELTIGQTVLQNGKEVLKSKKKELSFPASADEITMRKWMDFQLKKVDCPDWFKEMERLKPAEREAHMNEWTEETWQDFFYILADLMSTIVDAKSGEILRMMPPVDGGKTSLLSLYITLNNMIEGYQPVERNTFEWKGHTYIWPQKAVDSFGNSWYGQQLTTAEAIEALQTEHVYNAKDKDGVYIVADRRYHVDIALLAILSHRVKPNDEVEEIPLEFNQRRAHIEGRIKELSDAPMSVCLDMAFFLRTSKIRLAVTRISHTPLTRISAD